jgi:hypothetical protein
MSVPQKEALAMGERPVLQPTQARQGVTGHNVRYVLIASCALIVVAFIAVALFMAH